MHKVSHPVVLEGRRLHWPMAAALSCPNILSRPTEVGRRGGSRIDATQQQKTDCVEAIGVYTVATPKLDSKRRWVTKCVPMLRWTYGGQQYRREANRHSIEVTQSVTLCLRCRQSSAEISFRKSGLTEGLPCHSMKERRYYHSHRPPLRGCFRRIKQVARRRVRLRFRRGSRSWSVVVSVLECTMRSEIES
ncbi:hypothetical protein B0H14DRAFT_1041885 [Mycena olivaceomarginata]|nr:hypothetical protein B0H14DRAFT_1041885 [Mycena olivaceomarginata]